MAEVVMGTTPTITYKFKSVDVADITIAILTIKAGPVIRIELDLNAASVGEDTISWTLTQEQTLSVLGRSEVMINWVTNQGLRGTSAKTMLLFTGNHISEVI